ncbi:cytochrome c-550 PedF [Amphritea balenae]|uniref:Cytochrome c-550 PedF n=1 Tax=Amphritea balenae TaxID=452629 RepID=A0A3P1STI0_9GAMM|nr:cytochrome c-550 PedF [Amphritea balenae]RRD00517.1 cytochrome c-550 PedF [Amphritea balenae]GGK70064.1 cytochrome c-550 PedF [Amphritea balenae]
MIKPTKTLSIVTAGALSMLMSVQVLAHGDVTPQSIDTTELMQLGDEWLEENPYREDYEKHDVAVAIGSSAYTQNCARCHGLEAISGGIAPDLRYLEDGIDGDEWYSYRVQNGAVRDGRVYMPKMSEHLSQEALWAIRAWLETVSVAE